MIKQTVGWIVSALGIVSLAFSFDPIRKLNLIPVPASLTSIILTIAGVVLLGIGLLLLFKTGGSSSKQPAEVPIYHGKNVVGFRRMSK
jgi:multisubunit Na+/H+ antiporter MnhB subunit